jgi:hypothetical protein
MGNSGVVSVRQTWMMLDQQFVTFANQIVCHAGDSLEDDLAPWNRGIAGLNSLTLCAVQAIYSRVKSRVTRYASIENSVRLRFSMSVTGTIQDLDLFLYPRGSIICDRRTRS